MKKIILSLAVIAVVAVVAVGATRAYFSDTQTSTGNTFSAGTIDIAINGTNATSWAGNYNVGDLKPGETGNINFNIQNVGTNPVDVSKNLSNFTSYQTTGETFPCPVVGNNPAYTASSQPECIAENGVRKDDVQTQIVYDLSVKVYATDDEALAPIWWQQIYDESQGKSLADVYGASGDQYVKLGMIPAHGHMVVTQSYHFNPNAGNEYQGDGLMFNINIKAEQLAQANGYNTVVMENKGGAPDWQILNQDSIKGTLAYQTMGPTFLYNFSATVNTPSINYTLLYVGPSGNFPYSGQVVLGTANADTGGLISLSGSVVTGTITNGKVWLVPSSSYSSGWDNANNLYETGLVNYTSN